MEGEGDPRVVRADGGVVTASESGHILKGGFSRPPYKSNIEGEIGRSVDPEIRSNFLSDKSGFIEGNRDIRPDRPSLDQWASQNWEDKAISSRIGLRDDHFSKFSPFSNANSESSEREILLEPLSADDESTPLSDSRTLSRETPENEPVREIMPYDEPSSLNETAICPSEEREDISDEELELYSLDNTDQVQPDGWAADGMLENDVESAYNLDSLSKTSVATTETPLPPAGSEALSYNQNDVRESPSSDDREIIDLKFEDAAGKSDTGSQEDDCHQPSKDPSEDLETVSDDELPDAVLTVDVPIEHTFKLFEGGEQVSSSEGEGPASPDSTYADLQQEVSLVDRISSNLVLDGSQFSYGNISSSDLPLQADDVSTQQLSVEPPTSLAIPLAPLEAEPISDEEDLGHADASCVDVEGGEAGEIKSPADISSPVSFPEQTAAGLLGEVEPISADESSDTDGELLSNDEDSLPKTENGGLNSNNNFLESIDSEEDGETGPDSSHKQLSSNNRRPYAASSKSFLKQNNGEYMETISDEDDSLSVGGNDTKRRQSSVKALDESTHVNRDTETEKRQIAANFNEHQEELDYEENDGDDGEGKSAEAVRPVEKKEVKEAGECGEGGGSDKDEGELSDDDCEEGEIKEPGSKKPFVKLTCRFFQRGNCTWGINCRFIHPGINDKGNYQMIEIPGFKPPGIRSRLGAPGNWPEQPEEPIELPPPPVPDVPPAETAWERGLRIAKEQRKKASERKELEADFEDKRLNLSVDEERELNKENERMPKIIPKDPYYDQFVLEADNYYHISRDPWHTGHYENFEVRYNRENSFSPPYRDKPPMMPPPRFSHPYGLAVDKFGRDRIDRREPFRPEIPPISHEYPSPLKRPDEWTDPWRRSKSPKNQKRKVRSRSRGRRTRRSVSDSSNSSRSSSGSSSGSSRSSRTLNSSTGSSSRSRSPQPAPPGIDRQDRYVSPSREQPRSAVSVRGTGGYNNFDQGYRRGGRNYDHNRGANNYNQRGGNRGSGGGFYNNYGSMSGGPPGGYPDRDVRERPREDRFGRKRGRSPPDRPLPYVRPRPKSASSRSSSSRSRSRSRGRATSSRSRSRSSSGSSRSSSSSTSSAGSADSEHLYRDLGSPSKNPRGPTAAKRKRVDSRKDRPSGKSPQVPGQQGSQRRPGPPPQPPINLDLIPHPRDPKPPLPPPPSGRPESKYASRNAPPAPVKAKDPLKVVGQKSNIKLTLLPKQQQSSLGSRPNPLDSPPHKRRLSDRDTSPVPAPPPKRMNLPIPQSSTLRLAMEKASKINIRQEKGKSPPPALIPQSLPSSSSVSSNVPRARAAVSPQKQPNSVKSRPLEPAVAKTAPKAPSASIPTASATGTKAKKSMSSRREELLKQLKAVEDAIARKKSKLP